MKRNIFWVFIIHFMLAMILGLTATAQAQDSDPTHEPPYPVILDEYNCWHGIEGKITGYFHADIIDGKAWFVGPKGGVHLSIGENYMSPFTINPWVLLKRYANNSEKWARENLDLYKKMHFTSLPSTWVDGVVLANYDGPVSFNLVLIQDRVKELREIDNHLDFPDVWSERYREYVQKEIARMEDKIFALPNPPMVEYISAGNEPSFVVGGNVNSPEEVDNFEIDGWAYWVITMFNLLPEAPGKQAMIEVLKARYDGSLEEFNQIYRPSNKNIFSSDESFNGWNEVSDCNFEELYGPFEDITFEGSPKEDVERKFRAIMDLKYCNAAIADQYLKVTTEEYYQSDLAPFPLFSPRFAGWIEPLVLKVLAKYTRPPEGKEEGLIKGIALNQYGASIPEDQLQNYYAVTQVAILHTEWNVAVEGYFYPDWMYHVDTHLERGKASYHILKTDAISSLMLGSHPFMWTDTVVEWKKKGGGGLFNFDPIYNQTYAPFGVCDFNNVLYDKNYQIFYEAYGFEVPEVNMVECMTSANANAYLWHAGETRPLAPTELKAAKGEFQGKRYAVLNWEDENNLEDGEYYIYRCFGSDIEELELIAKVPCSQKYYIDNLDPCFSPLDINYAVTFVNEKYLQSPYSNRVTVKETNPEAPHVSEVTKSPFACEITLTYNTDPATQSTVLYHNVKHPDEVYTLKDLELRTEHNISIRELMPERTYKIYLINTADGQDIGALNILEVTTTKQYKPPQGEGKQKRKE